AQGPAANQKRGPSERCSVICSPQVARSRAYARVADVGNPRLAALLEDAGRFAQRLGAVADAVHVVNGRRTHHHIERGIFDRELKWSRPSRASTTRCPSCRPRGKLTSSVRERAVSDAATIDMQPNRLGSRAPVKLCRTFGGIDHPAQAILLNQQ